MPGVDAASSSRSTSCAEGNLAGVNAQDIGAALAVWRMYHDRPIESAWSEQRRIEDVRTVGGGEHDHPFGTGKAVHLGQDLVQRLFTLIVTAERIRAARPADRVDLIDEDDCRCDLASFCKQFAYAAGADAHDHFDELRRAGAEKWDIRLARGRSGQEGLAGSWRPGQQYTFRRAGSDAPVFRGIAQEVHDLVDFGLDLVDAGDIVEGDSYRFRIDRLSCAAAQNPAAHCALLPPEHPEVEAEQQQHRTDREQQVRQHAAFLHERLRPYGTASPAASSASRSSVANVGRSVVNLSYVRSCWSGKGAAFL